MRLTGVHFYYIDSAFDTVRAKIELFFKRGIIQGNLVIAGFRPQPGIFREILYLGIIHVES